MLTLTLFLMSCERKPLYLRGDAALRINVQVEADISTLWSPLWRESLKYDWNESLYGPLFYTVPSSCNVVVFSGGSLLDETTVQVGKRELIDIELNNTYDLLLYSKQYHWIDTYYEGGRYYVETPLTEIKTTKNEVSREYETVTQPGEIFALNKQGVYLSDDILDFEEVVENGKVIYVYNIDGTLKPISYIYIIQFIIVNDDNSPMIEAKDITSFTISGIASKKNMLTDTPAYTGNKQISSSDIKPGQPHSQDSLIFASRITILDLLPNDPNSSWTSQIDYVYYTNVDIDTYNFGEVTGTKDITRQLRENPRGGIITVIILNSELKRSSEGPGFGISLDEWKEHIFDVF